VVIVSGEGRAFCSGLDTKELANGKLTVEWFETWERGVTALAELNAISIAAIHGYCLGGGLQLALACDLRIASTDAIFSIPAVKEGVVAYFATVRLARLIGVSAAKELCLLGHRFTAEEGSALRLINEVVPPTMLEERTLALAQELLSIPFTALLHTKRQIDRALGQDTERLLNEMTAVYEDCLRSPEHATVKAELTDSKIQVRRPDQKGENDMDRRAASPLTSDVKLRNVVESDLPVFFDQQLDSDANHMAAFTARNPADRDAFTAHWTRILGDETITVKTILFDGQVAGSVLSYEDEEFGKPEVSYWIGKHYWGKGVATRALSEFLSHIKVRPLYARAVKDNIASLRVLEKCGFTICGEGKGFSNARGEEVEEFMLILRANGRDEAR
jgi:enoyl-CoA hydratase/carnithine racemase/RimJ/RimL family protein N-acetyltransferase